MEEETLTMDNTTSSDSDGDDDQTALELQTLATELSTNPANYDAHLQYITALRKEGDIDKLRLAREAMNQLFPLTPAMWQQWANDEISLISSSSRSEDAVSTIEKLYERGVSDYLSVSLWCDYLNFIQKHDSSVREFSPTGISKARDLFERALIACGLHVAEGSKLWEAYRSFEEAILNSMGETDLESREKQVQRVRNIFHRHLSIPHSDMTSTLLTYKAWESEHGNTLDVNSSSTDGISPHVASAYQKALDMLSVRADFEEKIAGSDVSDTERLQSFMAYLKFEQSSGDPARVKSLYERAITEFPISGDLWIDYTNYLNKTLKADKTLRDIYNRATRNCPWVGELWVRFMLYLERGRGSEKDLSDVFERSLQCTFSTIDEYVDIFLTRVDGLRRRISFAKDLDDGLDFSSIRNTFQRACDYLSPQLKNTSSLLQIHSYWARLESHIGKDIAAARGVWESLLKNSGSMLEAWQGYISMETEMGHINEARSLYKRCYSKRFAGTGSEDVCNSWIRFEREFGTLEDFDHALQKVSPRLQELQLFRLQQESKNVTSSTDHKDDPVKKVKGEKRKSSSEAAPNEESPAKRQKVKAQNKGSAKANKADNSTDPTPHAEDGSLKAKDPTPHGEDGGLKAKDPTPEKFKQYTDQCTAFVSNLNLKATSEDLRGFFSDVGGVGAIRILMDKFTKKSRGLAYVDFCDDTHLEAAVAKNKQMLLGKKLSIARSDPKGKRKGPAAAGHKASTTERRGEDGKVELKGRNTFAVPRALGWSKPPSSSSSAAGDEKPKSNEELRKLLLNKK
ncbi:putative RNA recognition motif domain, tetratricopeptide-like helical domain superfamily [Helianthus annuus]|nr:putative RNA recognition motif domain, tetratricopeptide-like helical domain superfamily [Helianthus annuus]KAJ0945673.1 putative RNA recognition motif domain, tetratricopeptide-like helical domain superfamily [Helianthus annuus]